MNYKEKIFNAFNIQTEEINGSNKKSDTFYSYEDPFDFFRKPEDKEKYVPLTQRGVRRAFSTGLLEIEYYIQMAASLRPLSDEAQDLDEITRMFSQQKLATRPTPHSVYILRGMISDENPEVALYAAEGLNSIENSFIEKIQRIKHKIEKGLGTDFLNYFNLGKVYLEFAKIIEGQKLIQQFYVNEAIIHLEEANKRKQNNLRIKSVLGEAYLMLNNINDSAELFLYIIKEKKDDTNALMKLADCFYQIDDFENLRKILSRVALYSLKLENYEKLIVYQWIM